MTHILHVTGYEARGTTVATYEELKGRGITHIDTLDRPMARGYEHLAGMREYRITDAAKAKLRETHQFDRLIIDRMND